MKTWLLVALLFVAGCDSDAPGPRAVVDEERPCAFAGGAEIAAAVDTGGAAATPVRARRGMDKSRTILCNYRVGPPFSSVTLWVESDVAEEDFRERMQRDPRNTETLEGAGDLAFTHAGVNVAVWEDDRAASASLQHFADPDETSRALVELGELLDSKL